MRAGSRIGSVGRDRATWLVLLALTLGVVLPAACVIWFMTEAASNQADAARQRLSDALQGQLRLLRERIDADWRSRLARLDNGESGGAAAFSRAVAGGDLDSVVFPGRDGAAGYPSLSAAPVPAGAIDARPEWRTAATLDAYGSHAAAAQHFAAIAARERNADRAARAVCFTGDGSLLMNIQELATLAELDLNVKIIVLDNAALGLVRQQQELFYGRHLIASMYQRPVNFVALAQAFGIAALDLAASAAPRTALANALVSDGPTLIRVPIDARHHVLPMVAPGKANVEAIDHADC